MRFNTWCVRHSQDRIAVEVRLLDAAILDRDLQTQRRGNAIHGATLELRLHAGGVHHLADVGHADAAFDVPAFRLRGHLDGMGKPPSFGPLKSGYDRFFGMYSGYSFYFGHGKDDPSPIIDGERILTDHGYLTDLLAEKAIEELQLSARRSQPVFVSLHFNAVHWPWEGPGDRAKSAAISDPVHRDGGTVQTYREMLDSLDRNVGRVLDALQELDQVRNTLVIFTSDNGGERFSDMLADVAASAVLDTGNQALSRELMGCGEVVRYLTRHGSRRVARIALVAPTLPFLLKTPDNPSGIPKDYFERMRAEWARDYPKWLAANAAPFFTPETSKETIQWGISLAYQTSLHDRADVRLIDVHDERFVGLERLAIHFFQDDLRTRQRELEAFTTHEQGRVVLARERLQCAA